MQTRVIKTSDEIINYTIGFCAIFTILTILILFIVSFSDLEENSKLALNIISVLFDFSLCFCLLLCNIEKFYVYDDKIISKNFLFKTNQVIFDEVVIIQLDTYIIAGRSSKIKCFMFVDKRAPNRYMGLGNSKFRAFVIPVSDQITQILKEKLPNIQILDLTDIDRI